MNESSLESSVNPLSAVLLPGLRLPPRPGMLLRLEEMVRTGEADTRRLAFEMSDDPGLVALLFKVARMSRYGRSAPPQKLEQVIQLLGVKQAINLARCFALTQAIEGDPQTMVRFWDRASAIAGFASVIAADRVSVCNIFPDQAYLAGIFHDCGIPILMQHEPAYCELAAGSAHSAQWVNARDEDARLNLDHCVVGALLARHWGLPDFVVQAIRDHHDFPDLGERASRSMVAILHLATHLFAIEQSILWPGWAWIRDEVMDELGIYGDGFDEYCDDLRDRLDEVACV